MKDDLDLLAGFESQLAGLSPATEPHPDITTLPFNLSDYDRFVVAHSGGKDSMACMLHLLEIGVPREKIALEHHLVDGRESTLMDWPCSESYLQAVADAFNLPLTMSYRVGGFEREMLRDNCGTAPITFTRSDGTLVTMGGERSKPNTRRKFPQVTADLRLRWCSGSLKGDPFARKLVNDPCFTEGKTLVITGERAEESTNRAGYADFELHRCDNRHGRVPRWIDHWRPVLRWSERQVWDIIQRARILCHPAYWIGLARASCRHCVFHGPDERATMREVDPIGFQVIADYERSFGFTVHRQLNVHELADRGKSYEPDPYWVQVAMSKEFTLPVFMDPWVLPPGAFRKGCSGPT